MASTVGSTPIRLVEMALRWRAVLLAKVFVTVHMPAEAISSGTRLGCGVSISERPTSKLGISLMYSSNEVLGTSSSGSPSAKSSTLPPSEPMP